ncbi:hypothetical protein IQ62_25285 [Streptomyces scabiei]|nr:hypothetical protein IQ62_25285 [Streptomyces scabiei]
MVRTSVTATATATRSGIGMVGTMGFPPVAGAEQSWALEQRPHGADHRDGEADDGRDGQRLP